MAVGRKILILIKKNPVKIEYLDGVKKALSETENKLVLRIPLVVRLRPIVIEPQSIVIVFQVEHVRIATGISLCVTRRLYHCPSNSLRTVFYLR